MSFANPLGLLALLAIPAVVALHLFRRRLRRRPVAGLFLWAATGPRADAGRRRSRLQRHASLWLELLAALVLALWLAGPRLGASARIAHLVLVVDDSASMAARGPGGRAAAEGAARLAGRLAEALPNDGVATVVRSGPRPEVLCGPRAPAVEVARALAGWRPSAARHDLVPALELAEEIGGADADLVLLTDGEVRGVPPGFRVEAFGAAGVNAAVLAARRGPADAGRESVFCDVAIWGGTADGRLRVRDLAGVELGEVGLRLEPGRANHVVVTIPAVAGPIVVDVLVEGDALPLDDGLSLPEALDRRVGFAADLDVETAARLDLGRVVRSLAGVVLVDDPADAHLRFTSAAGALAPGRHEVVVGPRGDQRDAWLGPYLIERRSRLCDGVTLDGVVWTAGRGALPGEPLALADAQPLCSAETVGGDALRLWLNVDPLRSNLTSSPDWPILLANLAEHVRARLPGLEEEVVPVGGVVRYRGLTDGLELRGPGPERRPARGRGLATWVVDQPGPRQLVRAGETVGLVAVHFVDPDESDLTGRAAFSVPAAAPVAELAETVEAPGRTEARVLALLLLSLLVGDWWVLRRTGGLP